ncbi:hypothetical protein [Rahnella sp. PCH160]|uniref:hypothetical protein n=1 Tax=Rahnella sp. PCH160 TaxID=3447928 RepID=UPI0039FBA52F
MKKSRFTEEQIVFALKQCSGQAKLATALEFSQNNRSDSLGVNPPLYWWGLSWL